MSNIFDEFKKKCLLEGLDDIALSLEKSPKMDLFEKKLKEDIDLIKTDPIYAEQVAHEKGYARENETIFYFPANEEN